MILGADPGTFGGLALWCPATRAVSTFRLPLFSMRRTGKPDKVRLATYDLADLCRMIAGLGVSKAVIEMVSGRGGQDASRSWTFGRATGVLEACIAASGMQIFEVHPAVWKAALGVPSDKSLARARASELMPAGANLWSTGGDDGLAEAALIAFYGSIVDDLQPAFCSAEKKRRRRRRLVWEETPVKA